ncbi:MAG: hypothetical protein LAT62_12820 [Natronospirillum sp.]|uniref:hypothetical protein n=1 Tax=Natronospirillum sp. TaxID=2812955 RepID=UPI0025E2228A|nr:hypothetical protein [Natronospirillum sp.]MCH8552813.1 hypothetical protein [Natronospirillum sp.]
MTAQAYQMVQATAQNLAVGGDAELEDRTRSSLVTPRQQLLDRDITTDCDSGTQRMITQGSSMSVIYEACRLMAGGVQYDWNGQFTSKAQTPTAGYNNTDLMEYSQLKFRQSMGTRYYEMLMNGEQTVSYTACVALAGDADMTMSIDYQCANSQETFDYAHVGNFEINYHAQGFSYQANGEGTYSGHSALNGLFKYETLEPLEYSGDGSGRPYMGTLLITPPSGGALTLKFEQAGVYINNQFYSWDDFLALGESPFADPMTCLSGSAAPGGSMPGNDNISFRVDGQTVSGPASALWSPEYSIFTISMSSVSPPQARTLTLSLGEFDGPGTYPVTASGNIWVIWVEVNGSDSNTWSHTHGGSGSIVVTEFTNQRISGHFDLKMGPATDNDANRMMDRTITNGQFSISDFIVNTP